MVNEHNGNAAGNDSANNNPGFRVPDEVRDLIVETFLTLRGEGDRTKGPSAKAVDARIRSEYPGIEGSIPSLQTINSILKPLRDAESDDPLDRPWSLSLWMQESCGIPKDDLPLLLKVQKAMVIDVEERLRGDFRDNRLTVREARWVTLIYEILLTSYETHEDNNKESQDFERLIVNDLSNLARGYALRERVILAMDKPVDSYDLDLELAWQEPLRMLSGKPIRGFGPLTLYREMRLAPVSTSMPHGQDMHVRETIFETPDGWVSTDKWVNKLGIWFDDLPFQQKLIVMMRIGIPVHVRFSTADWDKSEFDWNDPHSFPLFSTSGEYEIDRELMYPVWPLIKRDGVVEDSDPQPIKVATVFLV